MQLHQRWASMDTSEHLQAVKAWVAFHRACTRCSFLLLAVYILPTHLSMSSSSLSLPASVLALTVARDTGLAIPVTRGHMSDDRRMAVLVRFGTEVAALLLTTHRACSWGIMSRTNRRWAVSSPTEHATRDVRVQWNHRGTLATQVCSRANLDALDRS